MPHVKIGYPHKSKDGTRRVQGETVYVSSAEAKTLVADGKGKIVKPTPEEVVALGGGKVPAKAKQEPPKSETKLPTRKPTDG